MMGDITETRVYLVRTALTEAYTIVPWIETRGEIEWENIGRKRREERARGSCDMNAARILQKNDSDFKGDLWSLTNLHS